MAAAEDELTSAVLNLLADKTDGLNAAEIVDILRERNPRLSPRGVRNLLNRLVAEGELVRRKRRVEGPGAPPAVFIHKSFVPRQFTIFDEFPDISVDLHARAELELEELEPEERVRAEASVSALHRIAQAHEHQDYYARAIIQVAPAVAPLNPVDLVLDMAEWVVADLNRDGASVQRLYDQGWTADAEKLATELDGHIGWTKRRLRRLWRLDSGVGLDDGILYLPPHAKAFRKGDRAKMDAAKARERLCERIQGSTVLETRTYTQAPQAAAGTDASVADITLEQSRNNFIAPDPIAVMTAAAALSVRSDDGKLEYQDFDFTPDEIKEYGDSQAAMKGLIISPHLRENFAEQDFKHARLAAMDLRQYSQDARIAQRQAKWRPVGYNPSLGVIPRPALIFRDGRAFPSVHRLKDFEEDGLYGRIVQSEIRTYSDVVLLTQSRAVGRTVYGAVVKNPELSYLSPLIFWYLHKHQVEVEGRPVAPDPGTVYRAPFTDTAVSHLLFLGILKDDPNRDFSEGRIITTFRLLRRFSDIAEVEDFGPPTVKDDDGSRRAVAEDDEDDWEMFFRQRIQEAEDRGRPTLDLEDYAPFIHLCADVGVSMCYAAPSAAYEYLAGHDGGEGGHFLLPRLENTVLLRDWVKEKHLDTVLSWLATNGCAMDGAHTQTGYDQRDDSGLPILVPDVIVSAHEATTFSRDKMSEEVQDEIHTLINELRRRSPSR